MKQLSGNTELDTSNPLDFTGGFIPQNWDKTSRTARSEVTSKPEESDDDKISEMGVPATNWAKIASCKTVNYIKMGQAPTVDSADGEVWKTDKTVQEVEKTFATDLSLLIKETAKDETLRKTLVTLEMQKLDELPEDYRIFKNKLSTRFGLVFYEDNIIVPKGLRTTIITLLHKGHPASTKMQLSAKGLWWPRLTEQIEKKCSECVPCRASGKNIKPDIPKTEINTLPKLSEPNEEIQLDFIGPIKYKHKTIYVLLAMDRYSKWPTASLCKTTDGRTVKTFMSQYCMVHGNPKVIRTDKGTAFTGKTFRNYCKNKNIKLIYGTPYLHTPTGLVERGVRTIKESMITNLKDNKSMNESIDLALEVMRMTPHTRLKKSAFEMHFGRKPNTDVNNLLGINPNSNISANPNTLQVYSFSNKDRIADILPMKATKKINKENVSKITLSNFWKETITPINLTPNIRTKFKRP